MKILLDEQIHKEFKKALKAHSNIFSIEDMGWKGFRNGILREKLNDNNFDFLISADKSLPFQQNIQKMNYTIILIDTPSLREGKQILFIPKVQNLLQNLPNPIPKLIHICIPEWNNVWLIEGLKKKILPNQILFI